MSVVAADLRRYDLPLHRPWTTANLLTLRRSGYLLRLEDEAGRTAYGDASQLPGDARGGLAAVQRGVAAIVAAVRRGPVDETEEPPIPPPVEPSVRHAWVQAVLTLEALRAGLPLAHLLARRFPLGPAPAARVSVNAALGVAPTADTVAQARRAVDLGYRCLKIKLGPSRREVARVAAVREAVGPDVGLRLDANGSWSETDAAGFLHALAPLGIEYIEQPLPPGRLPDLERLHRESPIPIAADESARNFSHGMALIERLAVDAVVVKPMAVGGLDRAARLLHAARDRGMRAVVTDSVESAVGRTAALHLAALLGRAGPPCGLGTGDWFLRDVLRDRPRVERGRLAVPAGPGLGTAPPSTEDEPS